MKKIIDQNSAMAAQETALVPAAQLIDSRSEKERLSFLSAFAGLINFYDADNTVHGTWRPFLLKDPVFLLAYISGTDYQDIYMLYRNTCNALQREIQMVPVPYSAYVLANQLYDQVTRVFVRIEEWVKYMTMNQEEYDLKRYVLTQIRDTYSSLLWAVLTWRDQLAIKTRGRIRPVRPEIYALFSEVIWTKYTDRNPYQETLGLPMLGEALTSTPAEIWNTNFLALQNAGDSAFRFFHTIIRHADSEYDKVKNKKSPFPDTTLLRAFVDLLQVQQNELNGFSARHLDFYYRDILKQSEQSALADSVFITAVLAGTTDSYDVPAGTVFNAGSDANKNPVWFSSLKDVSLNPATITAAYTLSCGNSAQSSADLQLIAAPSAVATDESGALLKWPTFGNAAQSNATFGFAFASPMLLLSEGQRTITLTFTFTEAINPVALQYATFALSTAKAWLNVPAVVVPSPLSGIASVSSVTVTITLDASVAPIVPFTVQPDGLTAAWPMLRAMFTQTGPLATPPVISSIGITVNVTGLKTFQLYNDNGLLSTKTPFQLFGPIPAVNSNFLIGNAEIFSKPISTLTVELDWDNLPQPPTVPSFTEYYLAYNTFLGVDDVKPEEEETEVAEANAVSEAFRKAGQLLWKGIVGLAKILLLPFKLLWKALTSIASLLQKAGKGIAGWFTKEAEQIAEKEVEKVIEKEEETLTPPYFTNKSFKVSFASLQSFAWNPMTLSVQDTTTESAESESEKDTALYLFSSEGDSTPLSGKSIFSYTAPQSSSGASLFPPAPGLQTVPLQYDAASGNGFLRMTLTAPDYAFGAPIYANVVSNVALQNALKISSSTKDNPVDPKTLLPAPNLPFAPKVKTITAGYSASCNYDVTTAKGTYPLQCFYYAPFANYTAYDNTPGTSFNGISMNALAGPVTDAKGILLFPGLAYSGVLYLGLSGLIPDNYINLYFELARSFGSTSSAGAPEYFYLSEGGWETLQLISDGTNNFTCSGIVELNIPPDAAPQSFSMPGKNAWIAIAVNSDVSAYAQTVMVTMNGIKLQRTGDTFAASTLPPQLPAATISKPQFAIPQIATITQPFASFGGKAAEDQTQMNQRVSTRIKTKDRAMSSGDFFRLIREEFSTVYYSRACFDADANVLTIYVVRRYDNASQPNAFTPLVSACEETAILKFLQDRTSLFPKLVVSNFGFQYVSVSATISIAFGYSPKGVQDNIAQAINLFLSPWITCSSAQVAIDRGVTASDIATLISSVPGVQSVSDVLMSLTPAGDGANTTGQQMLRAGKGQLLVTSGNHTITITA